MYENIINDGGKGVVRMYLVNEKKNRVKLIGVGYKEGEKFFRNINIKLDEINHVHFTNKKKTWIELPKKITWEGCINNFEALKKLKTRVELYKTKVRTSDPVDIIWFDCEPFVISKDSSIWRCGEK